MYRQIRMDQDVYGRIQLPNTLRREYTFTSHYNPPLPSIFDAKLSKMPISMLHIHQKELYDDITQQTERVDKYFQSYF